MKRIACILLPLLLLASEPQLTVSESKLLASLEKLPPEQAATQLAASLGESPSPALLYASGVLFYKANQTEQSLAAFLKAVEKEPSYDTARLNAVKILVAQKSFIEAQHHLTQLLKNPKHSADAQIWSLLAHCQFEERNLTAAESTLRHLIALQPNDIQPRRLLLHILTLQEERHPEAQAIARQMLEENPKSEELWTLLATLQVNGKQYVQAIATLETARKYDAISPKMIKQRCIVC